MKQLYRGLVRAGNALVLPFDRLLNRIHTSAFNPLYRSGTIAVVSIAVAFITGLYLICFYRLGDPYASMRRLHESVWLGEWVRSFHRYASAMTLIAVLVHAARMFLQGKSWGRRALAWISGVFLLGMVLVSGWSGYVLVWDSQAQSLVLASVGMIDAMAILPEPMAYSFSGEAARPLPSFFFLFLFLHVVVPLAMAAGLWLHTSRLARAAWFPKRPMIAAIVLLTALVAALWPVLLAPEADLLQIAGHHGMDALYNFWVGTALEHPRLALSLGAALFLSLVLLPFTIRPAKADRRAPSFNDPAICVGCRQCAQDCPYEAIHMVQRPDSDPAADRPDLLAVVNPDRCVSCGICAASCPVHTMGPPGRKGPDQLAVLEEFLNTLPDRGVARRLMTVIMTCSNQPAVQRRVTAWAAGHPDVSVLPATCGGTVHPNVMEGLAAQFNRVVIAACPPRNCVNKDGFLMLNERVNGQRIPPRFSDPALQARIHVLPVGDGEEHILYDFVKPTARRAAPWRGRVLSATAGVVLVALIAAASRVAPAPTAREHGVLRLNWRLTGQRERSTVARTPEDLAALPVHMRTPFLMKDEPVAYRLSARLDGETVLDEAVQPGGFRQDGPLYVIENIELAPGSYRVDVDFTPRDARHTNVVSLAFSGTVEVRPGRITLIQYRQEDRTLVVKPEDERR